MFNAIPQLPKNVFIKRKGEKYLFLNTEIPDWIVTNSNGALALRLCNGQRTIKEISYKLSKIAKRDTSNELHNFFQEISTKTKFFLTNVDESKSHHPFNLNCVHLNLTNNCNLRCTYCYADERGPSKNVLHLEEYLTIIDSINKITKNVIIVLTGGEPLLSDHALTVADYAKKSGNQIHLLTNGILINETNADRISELFDLVKISIDGSTQDVHEIHRGKWSFNKALRAIDVLSHSKANIQISMTVTSKNIDDMGAMVSKFGSMLSFAPLFKAGRANNCPELSITGKEYYSALSSIPSVNPLSNLCSTLIEVKSKRIHKCAIGDAEISISDAGDVYPCHLLHLPQFYAGNVKESPLEVIYYTSAVLQKLRQLTVVDVDGCCKCEIRFICGGACRARAYYEKGRIDTSDNFCEYEKSAFINGLFDLHIFD